MSFKFPPLFDSKDTPADPRVGHCSEGYSCGMELTERVAIPVEGTCWSLRKSMVGHQRIRTNIKTGKGAGEMVQYLRACIAVVENLGSVASTH